MIPCLHWKQSCTKEVASGLAMQEQSIQCMYHPVCTHYILQWSQPVIITCDWLKSVWSFWNVFSQSIQTDDLQCAISIHLDYAIILINVDQCTSRVLLHTIKNLDLQNNTTYLYYSATTLVFTLSCFCGVTSCMTLIGKSTSRPCLYKYTLHMLPCRVTHTIGH